MTVRAIYEKGIFRPVEPLNLPENLEVEVLLPPLPQPDSKLDEIYKILGERYHTGRHDIAERHNELEP